jgi:anti-sigma-K factor RskA
MSDSRSDGERLDLTPLDPSTEADRFEQLVGRIRSTAAAELMRRQEELGVWGILAQWRRAVVAAAGVLAVASILTLVLLQPSVMSEGQRATVVGIPDQWADWIRDDTQLGPEDLLSMGWSEE